MQTETLEMMKVLHDIFMIVGFVIDGIIILGIMIMILAFFRAISKSNKERKDAEEGSRYTQSGGGGSLPYVVQRNDYQGDSREVKTRRHDDRRETAVCSAEDKQ